MSKVVPLQASMHRQVERLLPWLVNGTLEGEQLEQVRRHLVTCVRCQQDLREVQRQQGLYLGLARATSRPVGFDRLRSRLPAACATGLGARWRAWWARADRARRSAPPMLRRTLAVQVLLVAGIAAVQWRAAAVIATPDYRTLGAVPAAAVSGERLVVVFDPALTEARMRALLRASGARIVDGPSEAGAYVLVLPARRLATVQGQLRGAAGVVLVERLQSPDGP
jgi:hypothetical protein